MQQEHEGLCMGVSITSVHIPLTKAHHVVTSSYKRSGKAQSRWVSMRKRKWVWLSPQCSPIQFALLITKYPSFSQAKGIFITSPKGTPKVSSVIAVISNSRISQWYITSLLESGFGFLSHCHHPLPLQNTHTHTHNTVVKQGWGKYIKFTHLAKGIEDNRR